MNKEMILSDLYLHKEACEYKIREAMNDFIKITNLRNNHQINIEYIVDFVKQEGGLAQEDHILAKVKLEIQL